MPITISQTNFSQACVIFYGLASMRISKGTAKLSFGEGRKIKVLYRWDQELFH